jgi:endoglucanase
MYQLLQRGTQSISTTANPQKEIIKMKSFLSSMLVFFAVCIAPFTNAQSCASGGGATVCLVATATSNNIGLTWTVSGTISNVQVYRDTDSNPSGRTRIATVSASTKSYTDATAAAGTPYWYWIKFTAGGASYSSNAATATRTASTTAMRNLTSVQLSALMGAGWNLGNSLEAIGSETAWGNPATTQAMINAVKAAGFKTIRIPVSWSQYADANYNISSSWMNRVKQVVDYSKNAGLYVIINIHWDGGWMQPKYANQSAVNSRITKLWTQIANNFKNYDDYLLFAGTNEVMVDGDYGTPTYEYYTVQNSFNQTFVNAVRATGGNNAVRHLIVQGFNTNIDHAISFATIPSDSASKRLMMEVHFYDPYNFTLNESSSIWQWGKNATNSANTETWANEAYVDNQFQRLKTKYVDAGVAVIIGEFGAISRTNISAAESYRVYWNQYITRAAFTRGLVPVYWDNGYTANGGMGLFDRYSGNQVYPNLISTIVNAAK